MKINKFTELDFGSGQTMAIFHFDDENRKVVVSFKEDNRTYPEQQPMELSISMNIHEAKNFIREFNHVMSNFTEIESNESDLLREAKLWAQHRLDEYLNKIQLIKAIRENYGLSLQDSKNIADSIWES
jgi:hypothetical protein